MSMQNSYSTIEKRFEPKYRTEISHSRNTVEVEGVFTMTIAEILSEILGEKIYSDAIVFKPQSPCIYEFKDILSENEKFKEVFDSSDLGAIIDRLSTVAEHRHIHLSKLPEKTNLKIKRH
ncbi:hypothetical protein [Ilyobacter sp.]|uniref:hypothetical protein n=1 Tax=Ilyobacter sp. TaxID=3100343 RepID=UPI00356504CC